MFPIYPHDVMGRPPRCFLSACKTSWNVSSVFPICLQDVTGRCPRCFLSACMTSWEDFLSVSHLPARCHETSFSKCFRSACKTSRNVLLGISYPPVRRHGTSSSGFPICKTSQDVLLGVSYLCVYGVRGSSPRCFLSACMMSWEVLLSVSHLPA